MYADLNAHTNCPTDCNFHSTLCIPSTHTIILEPFFSSSCLSSVTTSYIFVHHPTPYPNTLSLSPPPPTLLLSSLPQTLLLSSLPQCSFSSPPPSPNTLVLLPPSTIALLPPPPNTLALLPPPQTLFLSFLPQHSYSLSSLLLQTHTCGGANTHLPHCNQATQ